MLDEIAKISSDGERVTHLFPNDCYYAHLSIYHFALNYCQDGLVLDAGAGAGYGSFYLAEKGARFVWGIDASEYAIRFCQTHFQRPNIEFKVMDLQEIFGFPDRSFNLIFSSNTLEHVPNVQSFIRHAWRLLRPNGTLVVGVPPIVDDMHREENIANRHHLNIWSPRQWYHVLNLFFSEVVAFWHGFEKPGVPLDFHNTPEECVINERDFLFKPVQIEQFYINPTLTVILVASETRSVDQVPSSEEPIPYIDDSFTRIPVSTLEASGVSDTPSGLLEHVLCHSWLYLPKRAWEVARIHGLVAMVRAIGHYIWMRLQGT